jgi:hypothetical protein
VPDEPVVTVQPKVFPGPFRLSAAGRPAHPAAAKRQIELARHHGRRALLVAIRRLTSFLADPATPVDAIYLGAFRELASRCGLPAATMQTVDATTVTANVGPVDIEGIARRMIAEAAAIEAEAEVVK